MDLARTLRPTLARTTRSYRPALGLIWILVALALALAGCKKEAPEEKSAGAGASGGGSTESGNTGATGATGAAGADASADAVPVVPAREALVTYRPLLDEVARAQLNVNGRFVDFGTADIHKYIQGGWWNRWGNNATLDDGTTYTPMTRVKTGVWFTASKSDGAIKEVVMRMRGRCKAQRLSIRIDDKTIAHADVPRDFKVLRFPLPEDLEITEGRHELSFLFNPGCSGGTAYFDWIWFSHEVGAEPPIMTSRMDTISVGDKARRALIAPTARTYEYFLHVPEAGELVFDYAAGTPGVSFVVRAQVDGEETKELTRLEATDSWQEGRVDLSAYATKAIRLELATEGTPALKGKAVAAGWGEPELMIPPPEARPTDNLPPGSPEAMNVVVITIDTVRADVFEPFGGDGWTNIRKAESDNPAALHAPVNTPNFDALAKESTVFSAAYDNENWTKPSTATILSGLYPDTHNAKREEDVLSSKVELMGERLQKHGFKTAGLIANGFVSRAFGFDQGWTKYHNYVRMGGISAATNVYDEAIAWVDENKSERFFLYIQTIDPHVPYEVARAYTEPYHPEPYTGVVGSRLKGDPQAAFSGDHTKLTPADYDWIRALYYAEVTYHDEHMGRFLQKLRDENLLDNTLFIITNDHGEELDDHRQLGHGHTLFDEVVRAPLLVRFPTVFPANQVVHHPVESVDIAPTMLEVLGLPASEEHEGLSLVSVSQGNLGQLPYYSLSDFLDRKKAIRVGRWKMHRTADPTSGRLYDVVADPGETDNKVGEAHVARQLCEIYLAEGLANRDKRKRLEGVRAGKAFDTGVVEMDPELKKQLEALGYFGGDVGVDPEQDALAEKDAQEEATDEATPEDAPGTTEGMPKELPSNDDTQIGESPPANEDLGKDPKKDDAKE